MSRRKQRIPREKAWEQRFHEVDHAPLLQALGVELSDDSLKLALTHRSFANEHEHLPNNERLEFLGDAVLGLSVATRLYHNYPHSPESDISKMRASIVSRYGLADIAREINLGPHILLGKGELMTDGANKDSILADTTEALLGAIYIEHGFAVAEQVVLTLFGRKIETARSTGLHVDYKTALQERAAENKREAPLYHCTAVGPDHQRHFTAYAVIEGRLVGRGEGPNKKSAEQQAAREAVPALEHDWDTLPLFDAASVD